MKRYSFEDSVVFRKTKEDFGGLSNMAAGFPIVVNSQHFRTSEALYQSCKFPQYPDIQKKIAAQTSPMTAKMVTKPYKENIHKDWFKVRVEVMKWVLCVKLFQHPDTFGNLLLTTCDKAIVESTRTDQFWGATLCEGYLEGFNHLGELLMILRDFWIHSHKAKLRETLSPPSINMLKILGKPIEPVFYYPVTNIVYHKHTVPVTKKRQKEPNNSKQFTLFNS